jgi:hypothetical protein
MKTVLILAAMCCCMLVSTAQEPGIKNDSTRRAVAKEACPPGLIQYINDDQLKTKAVLFVFNESLHPLGKYEFYDGGAKVKYMHTPMRMKHCTMIYIDTGLHLFHTMYPRLLLASPPTAL